MASATGDPPSVRRERLLDLDREIADAFGADAAQARSRIGVRTLHLGPGAWDPRPLWAAGSNSFALLVCDGLVVRELDLAGRVTAELIGPGDVIDGAGRHEPLLMADETWHVSGQATIAVLDDVLLPALRVWPGLGTHYIARASRQASRAVEQRAISQLPRVELRLRALLWHLADRWGRVTATGVVVPLDLTHDALGRLIGARRPTVTLAVSELARTGAVTRRDDGAWLLRRDSNPSAGTTARRAPLGVAPASGDPATVRPPSAPPVVFPLVADGAALIERAVLARRSSGECMARSISILGRCRERRARVVPPGATRLSGPPA